MNTKTIARKQFTWYKFDKILSYNAFFNFINGSRGVGKTYGAKKLAIRKALRYGEQFIYLRRYDTELREVRTTFFADIREEFPGYILTCSGGKFYAQKDGDKNKQVIGYIIALSKAITMKSVSFHSVTTLIYDEYVIETGNYHYLKNEVKAFLDFYSTVDRNQGRVRVFFLANAVSINNPYFIEYELYPDQLPEYSTHYDGFIACHFDDSDVFSSEVLATPFGRFIAGTDYARYAVQNTYNDGHKKLVEPKPSDAKYLFTLETFKGSFAVWRHSMSNKWYIQNITPKGGERILTLEPAMMGEGKTLLQRHDPILVALKSAFRHGEVFFSAPIIRNVFLEIMKR